MTSSNMEQGALSSGFCQCLICQSAYSSDKTAKDRLKQGALSSGGCLCLICQSSSDSDKTARTGLHKGSRDDDRQMTSSYMKQGALSSGKGTEMMADNNDRRHEASRSVLGVLSVSNL
ncbi:hypothetical protein J6590_100937 [Homalodisca vitripennis]|nr:hypothetical protein J6590_100937 [Homalodisca vitripennis]